MSHYPPNNSQPPNWQQPWQGQPSYTQPQNYQQPGQWDASQYNQPTQAWQQPIPPPPMHRTGKPPKLPKKPLTKRNKIIGIGCLGVLLLLLCGTCAAINNINANNGTTASAPTTIAAVPSDTPTTAVQVVLPTDTPTAAPTDTPIPSPTATPIPKPTPTQIVVQQPTPTPTQGHTGVNGNPWGYDFNLGNLIYSPNSGFCNYFTCVSTFWVDTNGYVAECANGSYTHSAGVRGACSRDGGVAQILYSH